MSPSLEQDRWFKVKEILATALELSGAERTAYLELACSEDPALKAEVESLIGLSDDADTFIEQPAIAQAVEIIDRREAASMVGRSLGSYRIVELIGEGGVGAVYKAVRADGDFQEFVALKLLKLGMDSDVVLRRFRDERRILARLNHPNIARFFDGGLAPDGRPYFVMELLEAVPIHVYCRREDLGLEERLQLFLLVCDAVEYSHRNLVIHRDLKPTNILVSADGVPKLLDYGIAKLLDRDAGKGDLTVLGENMLTPDYASPEQIAGEAITTSADVYSLGVLLYELLTDRRPLRISNMPHAEMVRIATSQEPSRPSSVAPDRFRSQLRGDLDTITLLALHKSPDRRYASAERLAEDIRRYLSGRPVKARPDTIRYRLGKFTRRNRVPIIVAAVSALAVFAGSFAAVYQTAVAGSMEKEARKRSGEIRDLANGLLGELDSALENLPGATAARELLARKVLHYLDELAGGEVRDPSLRKDLAAAYERLADIVGGAKASNLGNPSAALESYRKALALLDDTAGEQPGEVGLLRDRGRLRSKLSDSLALIGAHTAAMDEEKMALHLRQQWQNAAPNDPLARRAVASSWQELAGDLDRLGRFEEALANRYRSLAILQEQSVNFGSDTSLRMSVALSNKRLGRSLVRVGRLNDALAHINTAIAIERAEVDRNPVATGPRSALSFSLNDLGMTLMRMEEPAKALVPLTEALRVRSEIAEADAQDWRAANLLATARLQYGRALMAMRRSSQGIQELRRSLADRERLAERNPKNTGARAEVAESAGALADALGRTPEARGLYKRALDIYRELQAAGKLTAELASEPVRIEARLHN